MQLPMPQNANQDQNRSVAGRVTRFVIFFARRAIILLYSVFLITYLAQILGLLFSLEKVMYYFRQKMGWATTWAKSSQTHLITLVAEPSATHSFSFQRQLLSRERHSKHTKKTCKPFLQGCQMFFFKPKIPSWVNFVGPCNGRCWSILWPFGLHILRPFGLYVLRPFGIFVKFWYIYM
jgi:hypothetical protein